MLWWESVAPLGRPVVPEVYWMLTGSSRREGRLALLEHRGLDDRGARGEEVVPAVLEHEHLLERRAALADLVEQRAVVRLPEAARVNQQPDADLVEGVLELGRLVGGIDVDEDGAGPRGGVLDDDPLEAVRRPDADAVALLDPAREQAARREVDELPELGVGGAEPLLGADERLALGEALDGAPQAGADRLLEQRRVRSGRAHRTVQARSRDLRHRSSVAPKWLEARFRAMLRKDARVELLKKIPLFAECSKKDLREIARISEELRVDEGRC